MIRATLLGVATVAIASGVQVRIAAAQVHLAGDGGIHSHYVWRGLTRRNAFVWQPSFLVAYRINRVFVTAGGWTNVELTRADPRIDEALGLGARFGEFNPWIEGAYATSDIDVAAGVTAYRFPDRVEGVALGNALFDTEELYARFAWRPGRFALQVSGWYDIGEVDGFYGQIDGSFAAPFLPLAVPIVRVGGLLGFNIDQDGVPNTGYFAASGLTHLEFYVQPQVSLPIAGLDVFALSAVRLRINLDDATKRTRRDQLVGEGADVKLYFSMTLSWHVGL